MGGPFRIKLLEPAANFSFLSITDLREHQTSQCISHSEPSNLLRTASPPPAWSPIHVVDIQHFFRLPLHPNGRSTIQMDGTLNIFNVHWLRETRPVNCKLDNLPRKLFQIQALFPSTSGQIFKKNKLSVLFISIVVLA